MHLLNIWSHRLMVRTSPFHGGNMGSNPVGITNKKAPFMGVFFIGDLRLEAILPAIWARV